MTVAVHPELASAVRAEVGAGSSLLALGATAPPAYWYVVPYVLIAGIIWFMLIRPQRQQETRHQQMLDALKPGAKVVTTGGIYGTVDRVGDKTLRLKIADNVRIEVTRAAIAGPQPADPDGGGSDKT